VKAGCRWIALAVVLTLVSACGGTRGAETPQEAVERFLDVWDDSPSRGGDKTVRAFYEGLCRRVDPDIRRGLGFYPGRPEGEEVNCGADVAVLAAYTGDTAEMTPPSRITGDVLSVATEGDASVVTVRMRYEGRATEFTPAPPAQATVKVLTVRRDSVWWVATPAALNPLEARDGGMTEEELRRDHRESLRRAEED
jgi:hypothetical protein